jgi:hypothetical protein
VSGAASIHIAKNRTPLGGSSFNFLTDVRRSNEVCRQHQNESPGSRDPSDNGISIVRSGIYVAWSDPTCNVVPLQIPDQCRGDGRIRRSVADKHMRRVCRPICIVFRAIFWFGAFGSVPLALRIVLRPLDFLEIRILSP